MPLQIRVIVLLQVNRLLQDALPMCDFRLAGGMCSLADGVLGVRGSRAPLRDRGTQSWPGVMFWGLKNHMWQDALSSTVRGVRPRLVGSCSLCGC